MEISRIFEKFWINSSTQDKQIQIFVNFWANFWKEFWGNFRDFGETVETFLRKTGRLWIKLEPEYLYLQQELKRFPHKFRIWALSATQRHMMDLYGTHSSRVVQNEAKKPRTSFLCYAGCTLAECVRLDSRARVKPLIHECANGSRTKCAHVWTRLQTFAALSAKVCIPFPANQNLSVFCTNTKRTGCAGRPFHAPDILCSPQFRGK